MTEFINFLRWLFRGFLTPAGPFHFATGRRPKESNEPISRMSPLQRPIQCARCGQDVSDQIVHVCPGGTTPDSQIGLFTVHQNPYLSNDQMVMMGRTCRHCGERMGNRVGCPSSPSGHCEPTVGMIRGIGPAGGDQ